MKGFFGLVVVAGFLLMGISSAQAVLLDFNDISISEWMDTQIDSEYGGLHWDSDLPDGISGNYGGWYVSSDNNYAMPYDQSNFIYNGYGINNMGFTYNGIIHSLSFYMSSPVDTNYSPLDVRIIGCAADNSVYTSEWTNLTTTGRQFSFEFSSNDINRIEFETNINGWFAIDHLAYNEPIVPHADPAPVPEPSSLWLLSLGLIGLYGRKKR
jgi:hypothetical protein